MSAMTEPLSPADRSVDAWAPCEPGTLGGLRGRLRSQHNRRVVGRVTGGVAAAALALVVGVGSVVGISRLTNPHGWPGGAVASITCERCIALMPGYHTHLTDADVEAPLPASDIAAVAEHFRTCALCRDHFERLYPGVLAASVAAGVAGGALLAVAGPRARGEGRDPA